MMATKKKITSIDVGEYFIEHGIDDDDPPTVMKVLKLAHIAQGFHLSLQDTPFFEDETYAWKYGPVIVELYEHLKKRSNGPPLHLIESKDEAYSFPSFTMDQDNILYVIFKKYSKLSAWDLSSLTHKVGTPWEKTYYNLQGVKPFIKGMRPSGQDRNPFLVKNKKPIIIQKDIIKDHFKKIVTPIDLAYLLTEFRPF